MFGWNLGGTGVSELPKAFRDATAGAFAKNDVAVVQEYPRVKPGWSVETVQGYRFVTFRHENMWRGTGVAFHADVWKVISKRSTSRGVWVHLRHLASMESVWFSSAHFSPGVTQGKYEQEIEDHFRQRPRHAKSIIFQGDLNCSFRWSRLEERVDAASKEGKGDLFNRYASEAGLDFVPFTYNQWDTATRRPRQAGRVGTQIDYMLCRGIRREECNIYVDSCYCVGSDHECIGACFHMKTRRVIPRNDTRPREWTGVQGNITEVNQEVLEGLAKRCTRPRNGEGYQDTPEIKQAFKQAKLSKTAAAWTRALNMRKQARKSWEAERLRRASEGDWRALRSCRPKKSAGWDVLFAQEQQGDPHLAVHKHLSSVYRGTWRCMPLLLRNCELPWRR